VSDYASGYNNTTGSGWDFANGDTQTGILPLTPVSFKPLQGSAAIGTVSTKPAGYPDYDFSGTAIPATSAAAGAVQSSAAAGYALVYDAANGTVSITGATPDADGIYSSNSSVTLEATANGGYTFSHWTVNGVRQGPQSPANEISLIMDGHKTVRAICVRIVTVNTADSGPGSLREALSNAADLDIITIDSTLGQTISLTSQLPEINKTITIEGNGVILSGNNSSRIMSISGREVTIRRLHFRDGTTTYYGGAIYKIGGTLNLESCIFSGNQVTDSYAEGGVIYSSGTLNISGCTFYGNISGQYGGAIHNSGTLTLTGNLFYGNTASIGFHVATPWGMINSGGYNASDYASGGDDTTGSGWTFDTTDQQVTGIAFDAAFKPSSATNLKIMPSLPAGFPATYFDGTPRGVPATPGAVASGP
jgi:hypothetical protein